MECDADAREVMGLKEAKMAQAVAAELHWLPRSPPRHYLPPCLVVVQVHQGSVGRGPFAPLADVDEGL